MPSSRGSSQLRDQPRCAPLQADSLPSGPPRKSKNTEVGSLSLLIPGIEPGSTVLQDSLPAELPGKPTDPRLISDSNLKSGKYKQVLL